MTDPRKRTTAEVWQALDKVTADAELARLDAQSDEELDRALREAGIDPAEAAKIGLEALAKACDKAPTAPDTPPIAPKASRPPRKVHWGARLAAAAAVAIVVAAIAMRRHVAEPYTIGPDTEIATKLDRAARLRSDAYGVCEQGLWALCEDKLDAARAIDPAGDTDPRVLAARREVYDAQHVDSGHKGDKPSLK
jgi:hypothetical protein